jgi:hypothetical protein
MNVVTSQLQLSTADAGILHVPEFDGFRPGIRLKIAIPAPIPAPASPEIAGIFRGIPAYSGIQFLARHPYVTLIYWLYFACPKSV